MIAYDFHPEVLLDLDEIWEFIRGDNLGAADRLIAKFWTLLMLRCLFPAAAIDARTSPPDPCASF